MLNTKPLFKRKLTTPMAYCSLCKHRDIDDFTAKWYCKLGREYKDFEPIDCSDYIDELEPIPEPEPGPFGPVPKPEPIYTEEDEMVDKLIDALTDLKVYCVKKNGSDGGWCPWNCPWNIRTSTTGSCKWFHILEDFNGCPNDWPIENIKKALNR